MENMDTVDDLAYLDGVEALLDAFESFGCAFESRRGARFLEKEVPISPRVLLYLYESNIDGFTMHLACGQEAILQIYHYLLHVSIPNNIIIRLLKKPQITGVNLPLGINTRQNPILSPFG